MRNILKLGRRAMQAKKVGKNRSDNRLTNALRSFKMPA
jgi:hypothetical protein